MGMNLGTLFSGGDKKVTTSTTSNTSTTADQAGDLSSGFASNKIAGSNNTTTNSVTDNRQLIGAEYRGTVNGLTGADASNMVASVLNYAASRDQKADSAAQAFAGMASDVHAATAQAGDSPWRNIPMWLLFAGGVALYFILKRR